MDPGNIRGQFQRPPETGNRFGKSSQGPIGFAQVAMENGPAAVPADSPFDALDRGGRIARLQRNHADQVHRVGMPRIDLEDLPIDLFRRPQTAALMVRIAIANASEVVLTTFLVGSRMGCGERSRRCRL